MQWKLSNTAPIDDIDELLQQVLAERGIEDKKKFMSPVSPLEIKPKQLKINLSQLKKAKQRIERAIKNQEKVLIFGDYDADGITATSIVWLTLKKLGLVAQPFIPDRLKDGYGISQNTLERLFKTKKPDVIITVDNGIVAHQPLKWVQNQGIDVIVTDHHQPLKTEPPAFALVHSTKVSGAAVAWMLCRELAPNFSKQLLDLVMISTISDQMRLVDENRSIVKYGLELIKKEQRAGIKALLEKSSLDPKQVSVGMIGFGLAPRINAAGRISQGLMAVRLLCTQEAESAARIATKLIELNQERQDLTISQLDEAESLIDQEHNESVIFVSSPNFHEGIIGLLAGRLTEKYYKPSIVVASDRTIVKASARSVSGVNITDLIKKADHFLLSVGGHELAAGFSASFENLDKIKKLLESEAKKIISPELLIPSLKIDAHVSHSLLSAETVSRLDLLEPYGLGNREPVILLSKLRVVDKKIIGGDHQHLKILLQSDSRPTENFYALGWRMAQRENDLVNVEYIDLVCSLEINAWNGRKSVQIRLRDFRPSV